MAQEYNHPTIPDCKVIDFGSETETWTADHGRIDERGRKIGGRIEIRPFDGGSVSVRIETTRDGVSYGAIRKAEIALNLDHARKLAAGKLMRQRKEFGRRFPAGAVSK